MTNLERVKITFQGCKVGETFTRSEIIEMVKNKFLNDKFSIGSIIPSDYCYNLLNLGKINDRKLFDFNIFEYIDRNTYIYIQVKIILIIKIYFIPLKVEKLIRLEPGLTVRELLRILKVKMIKYICN